ncbi:MAG: hypothetical protein ACM3JJ_08360, partial [Hyphomicrobiales bacterium]
MGRNRSVRPLLAGCLASAALFAVSCAASRPGPAGSDAPRATAARPGPAAGGAAAAAGRPAGEGASAVSDTTLPVALPEAPPSPAATAAAPSRYVRVNGDRFELVDHGVTRPFFVRGVNLGAGAPGHFPGEFAFTKDDYRRYLRFARALHANAIRVYALHPPAFYEALLEENEAHPDDPIWLFQEVWTELPADDDFWDRTFTRDFDAAIRTAIDAVHGDATVPPRPGHASGRYDADVSRYVAGWLLGREWEPYAVRDTQARHPGATAFHGSFFAVDGGTAMETWLARALDLAAGYESTRYGLARAVAFVNWPTLDPMRHPTEYERGGREAEHDEDAYSVDPVRIRPIPVPGVGSGFLGYFANYHVYPYYPDFMNLDPGYSATRDRHGACNYAGYLRDLKAHTPGVPLLIGEVGVPNSRGIAHLQPQGIDHGGASETEQGRRDVRLLEDIEDAGCAGSILFSLFDEWFKVNWLVWKTEAPRDRDPLWHNLLDPEECYGLLGFDPPPRIHVDGDTADWTGIEPYARDPAGDPIRALFVTSDQDRFYVRLDLAPGALARMAPTLGVAIDVLDSLRGDVALPAPLRVRWSRGAEFQLLVQPGSARGDARRDGRAELFAARGMNWSGWSRLLDHGAFVPDRAPFRPPPRTDAGAYVPLIVETNRDRVARDGTFFPAQHLDWGRLSYGREPERAPAWPGADSAYAYDPHAEWCVSADRRVIEIALPWGLLNVGDPSSRAVLDDDPATSATETTATTGFALLAWATDAAVFRADSLGPSDPSARAGSGTPKCQVLGAPGTGIERSQAASGQWITVSAPARRSYVWNGWNEPITSLRIKRSAAWVREAFEGMESRERHDEKSND